MRCCKTAFGEAKLIRGRIPWRSSEPPTYLGNATARLARTQTIGILDALTAVLVRHGQKRQPKVNSDNLFDFIGAEAAEAFNMIIETINQGDTRIAEALRQTDAHDAERLILAAAGFYLNAYGLVQDVKCQYGADPELAFR